LSLSRAALTIFIMRLSNTALMMVGPIFLVRLLSVEEFGAYREFLVYISVLMPIASFCFNQSLMYFVPAFPDHTWRLVRQTALSTATASGAICILLFLVDLALHGKILGQLAPYIIGYTLLSVNLDFWEFYWLGRHKTNAAFAYTSGRLILRLSVVLLVAAATHSVALIIKALLALEGVRLLASLVACNWLRAPETATAKGLWERQLRYCLPLGASQILGSFNRYIGNILVARMIGPAGLAQYSIGTYVVPILYDMRNSVSDALLPRLARDSGGATTGVPLDLWYRANALFAMLLVPIGVLLARYAELVVVTLFSTKYLPAVPIFQFYLLALLNDTVDFGVAFRLLGITGTFIRGTTIAICVNLALLIALLPRLGILGAILALVASQAAVFLFYAYTVSRKTGVSIGRAMGLRVLWRVMMAAGLPLPLLLIPVHAGLAGIGIAALSTACYVGAYLLLLGRMGAPEIRGILHDARRVVASLLTGRSG
jgi:O-antigen/teichoic acid export membrane protein